MGNDKDVYFSNGNLQYKASDDIWRFSNNQWGFVGGTDNETNSEYGNVFEGGIKCDNSLISYSYDGWIDLFGWATSGYEHGSTCYQPWSTSVNNYDYYAYGQPNYNLNDQNGRADWGYNAIENGGNREGLWRTLTQQEWNYVFNVRSTFFGFRFAKSVLNDVNGFILLPDDWRMSYFTLNNVNQGNAPYSSNVLSVSQWDILEQYGAIFLPASGLRVHGVSYSGNGELGIYWSSTINYGGDNIPYDITLGDGALTNSNYSYYGKSVRLVQDAH